MSCGSEEMPPQLAARIFREIKDRMPLIHMLPNAVSAAFCADGLAALGARPLMAVSALEMEEITQQADASVINLGQLDAGKLEAASLAVETAARVKKPLVLDPVGCGASRFRLQSVQDLLALPWQGIIKGNRSEIYSIQQGRLTREGIDAVEEHELSGRIPPGRVCLVTGAEDLVLWDKKSVRLSAGRGRFPTGISRYNIVGSGCLLGAVAGACYSVVSGRTAFFCGMDRQGQRAAAAVSSVAASLGMAFALEKAALAQGYGMAKTALLDALSVLDGKEFEDWLWQGNWPEEGWTAWEAGCI